MKKLVNGVVDFRVNVRPSYRETFKRLETRQTPDCLFIACSDSRVVPNLFASTDPGDLFVVRNVGNLIPPCDSAGMSVADESEAAAIEFSLMTLQVGDIIVCGHSECGAMQALVDGRSKIRAPHLNAWLRHGDSAVAGLQDGMTLDPTLSLHNQLSQLNVLHQLQNLLSYPVVRERVDAGLTRIHGWWFDIGKADVYNYDEQRRQFVIIDEQEAARILARLHSHTFEAGCCLTKKNTPSSTQHPQE